MDLPDVGARRAAPARTGRCSTPACATGLPTAVFAFDLRQSDLPLQVAWPIMVSNLAGELLGLSGAALDPLAPSSPIDIPIATGRRRACA